MEIFRNRQFVSFKPSAVLSTVMKSQVIPLRPAQDVTHPFVQCLCIVDVLRLFVTQ